MTEEIDSLVHADDDFAMPPNIEGGTIAVALRVGDEGNDHAI